MTTTPGSESPTIDADWLRRNIELSRKRNLGMLHLMFRDAEALLARLDQQAAAIGHAIKVGRLDGYDAHCVRGIADGDHKVCSKCSGACRAWCFPLLAGGQSTVCGACLEMA